MAAATSPMLFKLTVAKAPFVVVPSAITKGPAAFAARGAENVVLALIVIGAQQDYLWLVELSLWFSYGIKIHLINLFGAKWAKEKTL